VDVQWIVDEKEKYIGGTLQDGGDVIDRAVSKQSLPFRTEIINMTLVDNYFMIYGKDFDCGCHTDHLSTQHGMLWPDHGVALYGYGNHKFTIVQKGYEAELDGVDMSDDEEVEADEGSG
jgi:hypothetical protein